MEIILHRRNKINQLLDVDNKYGVEIDLRTFNEEIILHHDPFAKGELFSDWIKHYNHGTLILNVKEEGLEERIKNILDNEKIKNYFFLDQSFPSLVASANSGEKNCAVRFSEYESIETVLSLSNKVSWVWADCFTKYVLNEKNSTILHDNGFKICLVSPELQGRNLKDEIDLILQKIANENIIIDAVCTKKPQIWDQGVNK